MTSKGRRNIVRNTNDSGSFSLRDQLTLANGSLGLDQVLLNIPGAGVHTIQPLSVLPTITGQVIIDATSQPGYVGIPRVELDGSSVAAVENGLFVSGDNTTIRGLSVVDWLGAGVRFTGNNNKLQSSYIGLHATAQHQAAIVLGELIYSSGTTTLSEPMGTESTTLTKGTT